MTLVLKTLNSGVTNVIAMKMEFLIIVTPVLKIMSEMSPDVASCLLLCGAERALEVFFYQIGIRWKSLYPKFL